LAEQGAVRILGFAGSARTESFNKKLVRIALRGAAKAGAETTFVDLRDHPLPLYDADEEEANGRPENAARLGDLMRAHDALLLASPEYNGFLSPLLKNTLDWLSRSPEASPDLSAFQGKVAALLAASPGPLGGLRGLRGVRELLANLGFTVLPGQITIRQSLKAFDASGELVDAGQGERVEALGAELADAAARWKRSR
jgi:NAD(P)H-dependent FMN reductase